MEASVLCLPCPTGVDSDAALQPFEITVSDGKVSIGRSPLTGITSKFVSRCVGNLWVDGATNKVWFEKVSAAPTFLIKPGTGDVYEEITQSEKVVIPSGSRLVLSPDKSCVFSVTFNPVSQSALANNSMDEVESAVLVLDGSRSGTTQSLGPSGSLPRHTPPSERKTDRGAPVTVDVITPSSGVEVLGTSGGDMEDDDVPFRRERQRVVHDSASDDEEDMRKPSTPRRGAVKSEPGTSTNATGSNFQNLLIALDVSDSDDDDVPSFYTTPKGNKSGTPGGAGEGKQASSDSNFSDSDSDSDLDDDFDISDDDDEVARSKRAKKAVRRRIRRAASLRSTDDDDNVGGPLTPAERGIFSPETMRYAGSSGKKRGGKAGMPGMPVPGVLGARRRLRVDHAIPDKYTGEKIVDSASDMEEGTPTQRLAKKNAAALVSPTVATTSSSGGAGTPTATNTAGGQPEELWVKGIGTVKFHVSVNGIREAAMRAEQIAKATPDVVDVTNAHGLLKALLQPFQANRALAIAMGKHRRLGAQSPLRRLSVGLLQYIVRFLNGEKAANTATQAQLTAYKRAFNAIVPLPTFGGVQHETVNSKRLRAILNSVFIATQLGSFDSKLGCVAVPPQCDSSTWNSALQSTMRWRELHVTHAILTLTGKNRLYCTPPGVMPVKNSLLTMLEAEVNAGQLTSQSNNTRYNLYKREHDKHLAAMREYTARALPVLIGNLSIVDATDDVLTFECKLEAHPKTFTLTVPTYRNNLARTLLMRALSRLQPVPVDPSTNPLARPPKRSHSIGGYGSSSLGGVSSSGGSGWDPVISVSEGLDSLLSTTVEPTEHFQLDRSLWQWLECVSGDSGVVASERLFTYPTHDPTGEEYQIAGPAIPDDFKCTVSALMAMTEYEPGGLCRALANIDTAYINTSVRPLLTSGTPGTSSSGPTRSPTPAMSGFGAGGDMYDGDYHDSDADSYESDYDDEVGGDMVETFLGMFFGGGRVRRCGCDKCRTKRVFDKQSQNKENALMRATRTNRMLIQRASSSSSGGGGGSGGQSSPVSVLPTMSLKPGTEGWESLAIPGLLPTLRDYQKKTVRWLLSQEQKRWGLTGDGWFPVPTTTGEFFYLSPFGHFLEKRPAIVRGGFLCDEMGLGKTVELIALILANPRKVSHVDRRFIVPPKPETAIVKANLAGLTAIPERETGDVVGGRKRGSKKRGRAATENDDEATMFQVDGPVSELVPEVNDEDTNALLWPEDAIRSRSGATLVVCPSTLVSQWVIELQKHAPTLRVIVYHGAARKSIQDRDLLLADVVVTSYAMIRYIAHITDAIDWHRIIMDESQCLKAPTTLVAKLCQRLSSKRRWCVTGTPFSGDSAHDLCGQLMVLKASPYCFPAVFNNRFLGPFRSRSIKQHNGFEHFLRFWAKNSIRNSKVSVADELLLPPRTVTNSVIDNMSVDESVLYKAMSTRITRQMNALIRAGYVMKRYATVMSLLGQIRQVADHPCNFPLHQYGDRQSSGPAADNSALGRSLTTILDALEEAHETFAPAPVTGRGRAKNNNNTGFNKPVVFRRLQDDLTRECCVCLDAIERPALTPCTHVFCLECIRAIAESERPVCPVCRSTIPDPASVVEFGCISKDIPLPNAAIDAGGLAVGPIGAMTTIDFLGVKYDIPQALVDSYGRLRDKDGAKITALLHQLKVVFRTCPDDKAIVFTQYTGMFDRVLSTLRKENILYSHIHGAMSRPQRKAALEKFMGDSRVKVFVLTLRSAAVGITLTAANHVFFVEPCMNLGLQQQAIGRVHRMGQTKPVHVVTLVSKGTIEENILRWNDTIAANAAGNGAADARVTGNDDDDGGIDDRQKAKRMEDIIALFKALDDGSQ